LNTKTQYHIIGVIMHPCIPPQNKSIYIYI